MEYDFFIILCNILNECNAKQSFEDLKIVFPLKTMNKPRTKDNVSIKDSEETKINDHYPIFTSTINLDCEIEYEYDLE